ncbi:MAG: dTDP-4-dehydrorhamnose 3,5-epimerase [Deltaproteobacteria bacterium]|nr:dTDP-4-dehydrorhamnose 3,5-epimerase [Deltaproteobacteria bacterium]
MRFVPAPLSGAYIIEITPASDDRGFFSRVFCEREFAEAGLCTRFPQASVSFSKKKGTLRGMHYQNSPDWEVKLIRCTKGAVWDAIIDLRPDSPTYKKWFGAELSAENHRMMYAPVGFAHGFLTLVDECEVFYQMSAFYAPLSESGIRWNDPSIGIDWPISPAVISAKDRAIPDFEQ